MIGQTFWNGLKAIIPIALTIGIIVWLVHAIDTFFGAIIKLIFGSEHYFEGEGFLVGIVLVFIIGIILNAWAARWLHSKFEALMLRIPLVKTLYNSITDLLSFFDRDKSEQYGQVVTFRYQGFNLIGLMTREDFSDLPEGIAESGEVAVYLPMSYQIGGYTIMIQRDQVKPIDMTVERAMRFIVTAGMKGKR